MLNQHHFLELALPPSFPAPTWLRGGEQESKFNINVLILRRKTHITTVSLASYNYSLLGKTVKNVAAQKQKNHTLSLLYLYQINYLDFKQDL